jgi:ATP-dependent helicase/nuclease subunit B
VLGLNETVFPAPPAPLPLLTEADRAELEQNDLLLASSPRQCLSRERYYAYIALTRARERVVLTSALYDVTGTPLNPSPFLSRIRALFPSLEFEIQPRGADWRLSEHTSELIAPLLSLQALTRSDPEKPACAIGNARKPPEPTPCPIVLHRAHRPQPPKPEPGTGRQQMLG